MVIMENIYEELNKLLNYNDAVVVGVSGGPDSMALLHILTRLRKSLNIKIVVCHINHNSGRAGQKLDEEFVRKYCFKENLIFELYTIENMGEDNFHNEARSIRYKFYEDMIRKYNAKYLFTAHHGDDLIETILMRITRGSTLKGYSGFSKEVDMGSYKIIRPLITVTKDEILDYNKQNKIEYRIDDSNMKDVYTRNRYRKYVLPFLKKEDSNVHKKFYKFSKILLEYNDYIESKLSNVIDNVYKENVLKINEFLKLEYILRMKVINYILESVYADDLMLICDSHVDMIYDLITSSKANSYLYLPNNIKAIKSYDNFYLELNHKDSYKYEIELDSYASLPNGKVIEKIDKIDKNSNFVCCLDSKEVKLPLHVRTRRNGDKMSVLGLMGSKKIKDIFIDNKVSLKQRDMWPIVIDSNGVIVWLPGLKKSKFDKTKQGNYDIILKYH